MGLARLVIRERLPGIDQDSIREEFAADENFVIEVAAIGEIDFRMPRFAADADRQANDRPANGAAGLRLDVSEADYILVISDGSPVFADKAEANPGVFTVAVVELHIARMHRARISARVELAAHGESHIADIDVFNIAKNHGLFVRVVLRERAERREGDRGREQKLSYKDHLSVPNWRRRDNLPAEGFQLN